MHVFISTLKDINVLFYILKEAMKNHSLFCSAVAHKFDEFILQEITDLTKISRIKIYSVTLNPGRGQF